jgi:glycosyltransferase involved in cell wall biosynthesis
VRVALITETWHPSVDGVVTRLHHTVASLVEAGHQVLVVAPTSGPPIPGVVQHQTRRVILPFIDPNRPVAVPDLRAIARALGDFQPTVVHVVNPVLMGVAAARQASRHYPLVASFHTDIASYSAHYRLGWTRPINAALARAIYRRADVRLATSRTGLRRLAELGIDDAQLWPPGVDETVFRPDAKGSEVTPWLNPEPHLPLALCVGRLASEKRCDVLKGVVDLAAASPSPVHLSFVGDGPDRRRLERVFAGQHVSFAGNLQSRDLAAAYAAADVLLFPSHTDTVGLVLLEAMATGLPVVAVDAPATRDTLQGYSRAVFLPVQAGAAAWLVGIQAARAARLATKSHHSSSDRAVPISWGRASEILLAAYGSLVESRALSIGVRD